MFGVHFSLHQSNTVHNYKLQRKPIEKRLHIYMYIYIYIYIYILSFLMLILSFMIYFSQFFRALWTQFLKLIKQSFCSGTKVDYVWKLIYVLIFFSSQHRLETSLMYKKSNLLVYIFVINYQIFRNNFVRVSPINLKMDMLYHMNNTFRSTMF